MRGYFATGVLCLTVLFSRNALACSLAPIFHQISTLRGRVVGKNLGFLQFTWIRQSFSVSDADLTLYEYRATVKFSDLKEVAAVRTDAHGRFDFGNLAIGHYVLHVASKKSSDLDDWFEVEITDSVKHPDSVLIDISPIHPDCSGGHKFIEEENINAASH